ncbi:MAG: hypothetical protein DMD70_01230 [Gemmatimonadetes bacterium]|nr:MAG: hypothetical protein DMD70_01230 [Gemmatimonadota bacterium]
MKHLNIATSSGIVWLMLVCHFGAALIALVAGSIALSVTKGGRLHKRSGMVFTWAMITTGVLAAVISAYEGKSVVGGVFAAYLVFTAATTVNPLPGAGRGLDVALMILAFTLAAVSYANGVVVWQQPGHMFAGVPAGMIFFIATICLLAAFGDLRMIREGGPRGTRRLTRHLWRMCFGLFIATGSFFLGQMQFVPAPIRVVPLLVVLAVAPLLFLMYWLWRVRLRGRLSGLIFAD